MAYLHCDHAIIHEKTFRDTICDVIHRLFEL